MLRRWILKPLTYLAVLTLTVLVTVVLVFAVQARLRLPDLHTWHRIALEEEFRADRHLTSFAEYRSLEDRLFAELRQRVLDDPAAADPFALSRYNPTSLVSRLAFDTPYNRSFELSPVGELRGAVLLVHGLTDSPYTMRHIAELFRSRGFHVVVLRMPGHGTIPAALVDSRWEDWYEAVRLAARHAAEVAGPSRPFLLGGYSTGATLVTLYGLHAISDPGLRRPDGLFLLSAAIGISPFAGLTNVVSGLSFLPYFEKARWLDVLPEYDPYKYNSFPVNAANQIYALTRVLQQAMQEAETGGRLGELAPVTVFQSIVDSTVTAADVINGMLIKLPQRGHELVIFDVNRSEQTQGLLAPVLIAQLDSLRQATSMPFSVTLIGNTAPDSQAVTAYRRSAGATDVTRTDLPLAWPRGVFSLGHLALPMPPDDPVLGISPGLDAEPRYHLGSMALRGESGALVLPMGTFARIRSNPFFDVIRDTIAARLPVKPLPHTDRH